MSQYVLIGTGVTAIAAAEAIRDQDQASRITLVGEDPSIYYSRPGLAYYLSGEVNEKLLFPYQPEDYSRLDAGIIQGQATRILPDERLVEVNSTTRVSYDRLLIATGAQSVPLNVPGANLQGVYKLDNLDDARRLINNAARRRTAVVTGGGITALELAEGLAARHVTVHYVLRGERYWPNVLDETESQIIESRLRSEGIILHHYREISAIEGSSGQVTGVNLKNGETIRCDFVAYAIGIAPRIDLAQGAGIACDRGILVDEYLQTNLPDIFAAGDAAQVYDAAAGKYILDSLWPVAREQGRAAGRNMAFVKHAYVKTIPFNVTRLAGLTTTIIGTVGHGRDDDLVSIARGDSETWRQKPDAAVAQSSLEFNRLRLIIGRQHLLGAVLIGDQSLSTALQNMIRHKMDISPIREQLLIPDAPIADILANFWADHHSKNLPAA